MFESHFLVLLVFSALISIFFGTLTRESPRACMKVGLVMFLSMLGFSLAVGYLMYIFPIG
jgi:hypothetical protein